MRSSAVVMEEPRKLGIAEVALNDPEAGDFVVAISHSGISSGTEKLLWQGRMPSFPGMGYPLVPGYEAVGEVVDGPRGRIGERVFVPGARCYSDVRGLFGGASRTVIVPEGRAVFSPIAARAEGVLLALAATAYHAIAAQHCAAPDLIVGHGTVGRLLARIAVALGHPAPTVWEVQPERMSGAQGYDVTTADADSRRDYAAIYDCTGDAALIDILIGRLAKGGEIVLAGFYAAPIQFAFAPAFMREARLRIAAEWQPSDIEAVLDLIERSALSLDGLVSDMMPARDAAAAYERAFTAPDCLKMVLDWSDA